MEPSLTPYPQIVVQETINRDFRELLENVQLQKCGVN